MARDLTMFLAPLPVQSDPGLDAGDPRLAEIVSLTEHGKHAAAADIAEELAGEGIHDIRVLSFLLCQTFREGGVARLDEVFSIVVLAVGPSFEAIGPVARRGDHFERRLTWLFTTIVDALEYHQINGTSEWDHFVAGLGPGALGAIVLSGQRAAAALSSDAYASAARALGRLVGVLSALADTRVEVPRSDPATEGPALDADKASSPEEPGAPALASAPAHLSAIGAGAAKMKIEMVVSHQFFTLQAKLRAFEVLVANGELAKAAIVVQDVQNAIESFDPRAYFPEMFVRFSALLSQHISPLAEHMEERGSLAWKAHNQFYSVDLDGFVRSQG
jgi:hypothetical protein